jgi:hypothetical protein
MVKHGGAIALAIAALPVFAAILAVVLGCTWLLIPPGLMGGAITFLLMKTFAELVAIIADMLLPK